MINTVADLLQGFIETGLEQIRSGPTVNHTGMIGDQYEGLSNEILQKAVFKGLQLKIVSGQITNSRGELSGPLIRSIYFGIPPKRINKMANHHDAICNYQKAKSVRKIVFRCLNRHSSNFTVMMKYFPFRVISLASNRDKSLTL